MGDRSFDEERGSDGKTHPAFRRWTIINTYDLGRSVARAGSGLVGATDGVNSPASKAQPPGMLGEKTPPESQAEGGWVTLCCLYCCRLGVAAL